MQHQEPAIHSKYLLALSSYRSDLATGDWNEHHCKETTREIRALPGPIHICPSHISHLLFIN